MENALLIPMKYLVLLKENIIARKNMSYIQLLWKQQQDDEKNLEYFQEGELVLWLPKNPKLRGKNLISLGWTIQSKECF
jgi:hypothetical protein